MEVDNNQIKVYFDKLARGLITKEGKKGMPLNNFEISGADKMFYKADAIIKGGDEKSHIIVTSNKVPNPVAVRYAFGNCIKGDIYNTAGLPLMSFRTDNWDDVNYKNDK
jgi:sialate O-acetylesterase